MYKARILIVEDEPMMRSWLRTVLEQPGHTICEAENAAEARKIAAESEIDLAMVDLVLPDSDGISVMKEILRAREKTIVIIMTAHSTLKTAVEAMKLGAYDYLAKPFDVDEVSLTVQRALETATLRTETTKMHTALKDQYGFDNIMGRSSVIQELVKLGRKIAKSEASTILLRGESGVGKDLFARCIHYESSRASGPFQNITCTTLQETLLESELFGHEKGAFTDAKTQKRGLLEIAHGGTVFLDEIGDITPTLQAKLLHFLEHKTFRRVGGTEDIAVDVRVIAATNRELETAIQEGKFRQDLYYRLNVMPLVIPPLRERPEDVPALAHHFIAAFNRDFKKTVKSVSKEAMAVLMHYHWPGNVRELRNVIERAMLLVSGPEILPEDLLIQPGRPAAAADAHAIKLPPEGLDIEETERSLVVQALERTRRNQTAAVRLLGCSRNQIRYRIEKFQLRPPLPKNA
jgi:DNA-binding NtrC family response regulator